MTASARRTLTTLALLYTTQGIPFGFAAEYLPVIFRQAGYSRTQIAAIFWLQLPWQLKPLWAGLADRPSLRPYSLSVLVALQLTLAAVMASYALFSPSPSPWPWFALTALAAFFAATQDVFVDAFAVRSLTESDRGFGNSAQIAGYRFGIILGGGGTLVAGSLLGETFAATACATVIFAASIGAFVLRKNLQKDTLSGSLSSQPYRTPETPEREPKRETIPSDFETVRRLVRRDTWRVAAIALTFKLGAHSASVLLKPLLVDNGWTASAIGSLVVTLGTGAAVLGSIAGGWLYQRLGERRALTLSAIAQALTVAPLVLAAERNAPRALAATAIALEHLAGGLASTVLFAALMTATLRARAGLHYTLLTGLNAGAIGLGGLIGALTADKFSVTAGFALSAGLCLIPCIFIPGWNNHARASAGCSEDLTPAAL